MMALKPIESHDQLEWKHALKLLPHPHILQTWEWGDLKSRYGWEPTRLIWRTESGQAVAAAQILQRRIASSFRIQYCPRGPILDWSDAELRSQVVESMKKFTIRSKAIFLKIDPEVVTEREIPGSEEKIPDRLGSEVETTLQNSSFVPAKEQIQFRNTMQLDLQPTEEELLAGMKQKTRYNIRLASRKGVKVFLGSQEDFELLFKMYAETSIRDKFTIRDGAYYHDVWEGFHHAGMAQHFVAAVDGSPIAGLIVFRYRDTAWYLYGMSRDLHRDKMPNHLLQWEAIKWAKATGSSVYDFWGAPDEIDQTDPMWGVYRFKAGFGAGLIRTIGAWDFVARPALFRVYSSLIPKVLSILRRRGRTQTRQAIG